MISLTLSTSSLEYLFDNKIFFPGFVSKNELQVSPKIINRSIYSDFLFQSYYLVIHTVHQPLFCAPLFCDQALFCAVFGPPKSQNKGKLKDFRNYDTKRYHWIFIFRRGYNEKYIT